MSILKIMLITLILGGLAVPAISCASESNTASAPEKQVVTVQRGNLVIDITAVGNLALSLKEDLAIDLFYPEGTIEEVLVEEGDTVEEGQVVVKLDTEEWEEQLEALEDKVVTAERQLTANERSLLQVEINLWNAEIALEEAKETYIWPQLEVAEADVEEAEARLQYAIDQGYDRLVVLYQDVLEAAEKRLDAMLTGADTDEIAIKKLQLELAMGQLDDAQQAIEDARKDLEDAQETLDEAKSKSPLITATFDGFITSVNVEGGDEVLSGAVAVQLADPTKFEADLMVSEMDIFQVKVGGGAWVQVDAMPVINLPAKVTHISPTATIQSGVVNYEVKVEIQSLEAVMQEQQEARLEAVMQEQQEARQEGGGWQAMPAMIPEGFQLREGLTVTVSIIVEERNNVLLVPNQAIIRQGRETYVQVLKDGVIKVRSIRVGISNWQYTEVTDGLSEGEKVVVPETATTTTPEPERPMPLFPGGMRPH